MTYFGSLTRSMAFTIRFSERARQDVHDVVDCIQQDSPLNATRWRRGLYDKLAILRSMATSFAYAPENEYARCEVRQLLYGRYRVLYTVREQTAFVLTIRHGARQFMRGSELTEIDERRSD